MPPSGPISSALALTAACLAVACALPWAHARADDRYYEPDFEKVIFSREALLLEPQEVAAAVKALSALASNFPDSEVVDQSLRAKALAIALRLDGTNPGAIAANTALRRGEMPPGIPDIATVGDVAQQLWTTARDLESPEIGRDERILQFCLAEIARSLDPTNLAESNRYPTKLPESLFAGWSSVLRDSNTPTFEFPPDNNKPNPQKPGPPPKAADGPGGAGSAVPRDPGIPLQEAEGSYRTIVATGDSPTTTTIRGNLRSGGGSEPLAIIFSDEDGDTTLPLNQFRASVVSALAELQNGWPKNGGVVVLTIGADGRDDRSLTLPGAILADSLIRGHALAPRTLAVGVVAPEGSLVATDRLYQRLHSFKDTDDDVIIVPEENLPDLYDMLLLGDFAPLFRHQILIAGSLGEAVAIASAERGEKMEESLRDFQLIQEAARDSPLAEMSGFKTVRETLVKIIALNPRHASASALLKHGSGELPEHLTRNGSLAALYRAAAPIINSMQDKEASARVLGDTSLASSARRAVTGLQPILNPETAAIGETMRGFLADIETYAGMAPRTSSAATALNAKIFATWEIFRDEFSRLKNSDSSPDTD